VSLPFSASADRNKEVIGDALTSRLKSASSVLEIGSGTGQHAVYLCERFPHLSWQPSERLENLDAIRQWIAQSGLKNIKDPLALDVSNAQVLGIFSFAISVNTAHIMSIDEVAAMFATVSAQLKIGARFALYGPFRYNGQHSSPSNESFDAMLKQQAPHMGVRDKADLDQFARESSLEFVEDIEMPANNRILVWRHF